MSTSRESGQRLAKAAWLLQVLAINVATAGCATHEGHSHAAGVDAQDAVIAAGARHHVKLENEHVRVLETVINPGETVPMHTHRWPSAQYFVEISDLGIRDVNGDVLSHSRTSAGKRKPGGYLVGVAANIAHRGERGTCGSEGDQRGVQGCRTAAVSD